MALYSQDLEPVGDLGKTVTHPACDLVMDVLQVFTIMLDMLVTPAVASVFGDTIDSRMKKRDPAGESHGGFADLVRLAQQAGPTMEKLLPAVMEMGYCRAVDAYLTYVSRLTALVLETNPACLRTKEQVSLELVLDYPTHEELVAELADRMVHRLSFKSLSELDGELKRRIGLQLFTDDSDLAEGVRAVETRNLIVHSRGVATKRFARHAKALKLLPGERIAVGWTAYVDAYFLLKAGIDLDKRAVAKHKLPVVTEIPDEHAAVVLAIKERWSTTSSLFRGMHAKKD